MTDFKEIAEDLTHIENRLDRLGRQLDVLEHSQVSRKDRRFLDLLAFNAYIISNVILYDQVAYWWVIPLANVPALFGWVMLFRKDRK